MKLTWRADMRWITSSASPPCEMAEVELKRLATLEGRILGDAGPLLNPGTRRKRSRALHSTWAPGSEQI